MPVALHSTDHHARNYIRSLWHGFLALSCRSDLIELINGPLSKNDRKKLITLCTVDVHARDVVQRLIDERVENGQCFQWQSQLRYYQNEKTKECQVGGAGYL